MDSTVQVGCEMQDVSSYSHELTLTNDGNQVFWFDNKICQYKREPEWAGINPLVFNKTRARDEVKIRYAIIVSGETENLDKLNRTINSILTNQIKPVHLGVFCQNISSNDLDGILDLTGVPWQLMEYVGAEDYKSFALLNSNIWAHFFVFIKSGFELKPGFMDRLDRKINDENFRFTFIADNSDLMIFSKNLYYFNELPINELLSQLKQKGEGYFEYASVSTDSP